MLRVERRGRAVRRAAARSTTSTSSVGAGETIAVLGPSGCGQDDAAARDRRAAARSTAGASAGTAPISPASPPHERHFGLMFQEYALFPHRDVAGNVEFGLRMTGLDRADAARAGRRGARSRRARRARATARVATLSGGEQQRVALGARAGGLAPPAHARRAARRARPRLAARGCSPRSARSSTAPRLPALYVTHDHDEAFAIADRVAIMRAGRVVQVGRAGRRVARAGRRVDRRRSSASARSSRPRCATGGCHTPWGRGRAPAALAAGAARSRSCVRPDACRLDAAGPIDGDGRAARVHRRLASSSRSSSGPGPPLTVVVVAARRAGRRRRACGLSIDPDGVLVYPRRAD